MHKMFLTMCDFTQAFPESQSLYWTALLQYYKWHEIFVSMYCGEYKIHYYFVLNYQLLL